MKKLKYDLDGFKRSFEPQETILEMIDFIVANETCLKVDLVNAGVFYRLANHKRKPVYKSRMHVEYLLEIGFIVPDGDESVALNYDFLPHSQGGKRLKKRKLDTELTKS